MHVRDTLQAHLGSMRRSEAHVVRRLVREPGLVAAHSLREVAAALSTSDATVMRACRAAGFDGFQDLKYHVLREYTAGVGPTEVPVNEMYRGDIAASLAAAESALEGAAVRLRGARRVVLAGVGASQGVALIASDILFTLGKQALVVQTEQTAAFAFTPPLEGLVLVAISHSGETRFPIRIVSDAREAGVFSIGMTNEPASELAGAVDLLVPTQAVEPARGSYAVAPRICQLAVLDALFGRVGAGNGGAALKAEGGRQRAEGRGQRSAVGGRRSEGGGRRTEGAGPMTNDE